MSDKDVHTYPLNDKQEHILIGTDCPCEPRVAVHGANLIIMHNSFDHREIIEEIKAEQAGDK